ncbi:hypothetical protein LOTGIDRAFT_234686 [Lottia gigantea]|uniref:Nuclear receptor coactivator 6 TRADD-N domain-containing protein n=1 Tax=Lottia gigantea TaxID=225164 RepID=V3ZAU8_LOTGI|nr:hypothetical protein LOTGIDRAFT_234686 [Lottia gigantea]ESO88113.1 hypothetical protein LOTGIDRAFT_234686 [Lottia gigantea]
MGPQEDYIETVVTCEGDFHDPELHRRLEEFRLHLKELLSTDSNQVILKKVEPWNSVRVTFNITKEAALRLKQFAQQGNATLRSLGVLAVQIEGDQIISLTIAGRNNERAELILKTNDSNRTGPSTVPGLESGLQSSDEVSSPGPNVVEATRKNIADYLRKGTSLFDIFNPNLSVNGKEVFRSPNVVATSSEPIPFKANNILSSSNSTIHGTTTTQASSYSSNFPPGRSPTGYPSSHSPSYPSPTSSSLSPVGQPGLKFPSPPGSSNAMNNFPNLGLPPPPPYPHTMAPVNNIPRQGKTVTAASPLLVNLLQTEPLVAGLNNLAGQKMLPPNEGGPPVKKKRKPRKPKDSTRTSVDGEIPIESIPNPGLDGSSRTSVSGQPREDPRIPTLPNQSNHTQGVVDSVNFMEHERTFSAGNKKYKVDDPFPPEVTAGKIVNPYTGELERIEKSVDNSPNKSKSMLMTERLTCTVSEKKPGDLKLRIGPLIPRDKEQFVEKIKQSVAATRTSSLTTQNISPISNKNSHPSSSSGMNKGNVSLYSDNLNNHIPTSRSVAMDIYATEHSSHCVNTTVNSTPRSGQARQEMKSETSVFSGVSSVPKSVSNSSVMHTLSSTSFTSGTNVGQSKLHNSSTTVPTQNANVTSYSSSFTSQDTTLTIYSHSAQSRAKLDPLPSLNSPNIRNTEVHSITGSPNGKVSCEGDESSNHSVGIMNDMNTEGPAATVSPVDSSGNKVYNHDSGVGSSSERSDDTPSEPGDEFRTTTQVHVEVSGDECLKSLKYTAEMKTSKVMTVGYVMNNDQTSTHQNSMLQKEPMSKLNKFEQILYGHKHNDVKPNNVHLKVEKEITEKRVNGPTTVQKEQNSYDHKKLEELPKSKSPGHSTHNNVVSSVSSYIRENCVTENGPSKPKSSEKKQRSNPQSPRQGGKTPEPPKLDPVEKIQSHYVNNYNDWPDLNLANSFFGHINTDNFDSHQFEGLEFDSPPNSEKFAGFTEQDILQATAKGLAYKAQAALDGTKGSNITSKYSKRSSPVNVNMLNHLYAPGLPLPRRLTESVQRLVKPLPSNELSLPHSRACKSPGSSKNANGATSPRSCASGTKSPGASVCRTVGSSGGLGQNFMGQNMNNLNSAIPSSQYGSVNNTNSNSHVFSSVSSNSVYSPSSDISSDPYHTSITHTSQHHSKCVPSISQTVSHSEMANDKMDNMSSLHTQQPLQSESVPFSVCNISQGSDNGASFQRRNDSTSENPNLHLSANICATEQTISNDLSKSASEKTVEDSGCSSQHLLKTVSKQSDNTQLSSEDQPVTHSVTINRSDDTPVITSVPPFVSSASQHSTSNLSGSTLTTQTSVSYSRQHGVLLTSVDLSNAVPSPSVDNKPENIAVQSVSKTTIQSENMSDTLKTTGTENLKNGEAENLISLTQESMSVVKPEASNEKQNIEPVKEDSDSQPPVLENHLDVNTVVSSSPTTTQSIVTTPSSQSSSATTSSTSVSSDSTPPVLTLKETSPLDSDPPQRRLTRKRKSNNSESESSEAKEMKISEEGVFDNDAIPTLISVDGKLIDCKPETDEKPATNEDNVGMKDDDLLKTRGRRNKPQLPGANVAHSFFAAPVIQGRTRSQSSTPAVSNDKHDLKEETTTTPVTTQKRATRSVKQKDQSDSLAKRRRSRDHRQ